MFNLFCFSSSERFLFQSWWYWQFFSCSSSERRSRENLSVSGLFCLFSFFLQKNFHIFCVLLFKAFLCLFDNIYLPFLYINQKVIEKCLIVILVFFSFSSSKFSSWEFSSWEFSPSESEEISTSSTLYLESFFLWQHIYILLDALEDNNCYMFYRENQSKLLVSK